MDRDVPLPSPAEPTRSPISLSRAQKRFFGLIDLQPRSDEQAQPPEAVQLTLPAQRVLLAHLEQPGTVRSGPLFGTRSSGEIHITHAALGRSLALSQGVLDVPFALDERYLLGWSDCLSHFGPPGTDWVGQWLIARDNQIGSLDAHLCWIRLAQRAGLMDEEHVLLFLGHQQERVAYLAYLRSGRGADLLPVERLPDTGR